MHSRCTGPWSDSDAPCIVELVGWLEQKIEQDGLKYIETDLVQNKYVVAIDRVTWQLEVIEKCAILSAFLPQY